MKLFLALICVISTIMQSYGQSPAAPAPTPADWTIMCFMNGDNSLSASTLSDFEEMARVGSNKRVKVVAQIDRLGKPSKGAYWGQTLRFEVTKGIRALPKKAVEDLGEINMGDGQSLINFVNWAQTNYPANRYMLIIWDHGQGWRFTLKSRERNPNAVSTSPFSAYKSISEDETDNHDKLYNREIQDALSVLRNRKLDIIGFDACLMSMAETAYAFRDAANIMVSSQELIPNSGWQYEDLLTRLNKAPSIDAAGLSRLLVQSYEFAYTSGEYGLARDPTTTLSAISLEGIAQTCSVIDNFSAVLIKKLDTHLNDISGARAGCAQYAPLEGPFYHIDLSRFCDMIISLTKDHELFAGAQSVKVALKSHVLANYIGTERGDEFGSNGLCIYFPPDLQTYADDKFSENGYEKNNTLFPVQFVQHFRWADFLHAYFKKTAGRQ